MKKALLYNFIILIVLFNSCFLSLYAQKNNPVKNKSDKVEIINGKKYFIHTVLKKQTLYAIAKSYEVSIDTILALNPNAKLGIKTDEILMIPVMGEKKETVFHKVVSKETLYSIAKQYNLEVADLIKANPELSNGLKEEQIIIIPPKTIKDKHNNNNNNNIKYPEKKDSACMPVKTDKVYNVALMIPLYLEDIFKLDLGEIKSIDKQKRNKSFTFIPFYEGVLLALDSLQETGMSVNLYVYDVEKDTNKVKALLDKPEIKTMDLIIGPFFNESLKQVIAFAKPLNINVVSPLSFDNDILKSNPNVFQVMPSQYMQLESMAKYILKNYTEKDIIIVHNGLEKEMGSVTMLKNILDSLNQKKSEEKIYKEVFYNTEGLAGVKKYFSEEKENIIITFTSDQVFLMNYVRDLSALADKYKIILFGLPHWRSFENVETEYFLKCNLHLTSTCFIDYENPAILSLVKKYRNQYYTEPDKYVFQGFDEAFYFLSILKTYGKDFENCLVNDTLVKYQGLSTYFKFGKPTANGYENNYVTIYKYEDYKLIQLSIKE